MHNNQNLIVNQTTNTGTVHSLLWERLIRYRDGAESQGVTGTKLPANTVLSHRLYGVLPMAIKYGFVDYSKPIDFKRPVDWAKLTEDVNSFTYYAREAAKLLEPIDWRVFKGDVNGLIKAVTRAWEKEELIEEGLKLGVKVELFEHDLKELKIAVELAEEFAEVAKQAQDYTNIDPDDYYDYEEGLWDIAGLRQAIKDEAAIESYHERCAYRDYYQSVRI